MQRIYKTIVMKNALIFLICAVSMSVHAQNLKPTNDLALVTVTITNMKGVPSIGDLVRFKSKKTGKLYSGTSMAQGKFQILLPKETFMVLIQGFETEDTKNELVIPNVAGEINFTYTIRYELPKVFVLNNVHFDVGKTSIRPDSYETLNNLAELMKRKKTMIIELAGHTDNVGNAASNQKLSEQRAESVKKYLIQKGVPAQRIIAVGYGSTKPVASNDTDEGKQKNRRTEVNILHE